ncbi:hypothetical protein D3C71_188970 [compost metagenome]
MKRPDCLTECRDLCIDHPKRRLMLEASSLRRYVFTYSRGAARWYNPVQTYQRTPAVPQIGLRAIFLSPQAKAAYRELCLGLKWHLAVLALILLWHFAKLMGAA